MDNVLFSDSEVFQKERPTKATDPQVEQFYDDMAEEVVENGYSSSKKQFIIEDLKELYPFRKTGFEMAKVLDGSRSTANYEIDSQFIQWLEMLEFEFRDIITENVKTWVKAHNPLPKFERGDELEIVEQLCWTLKKGVKVFVTGFNTSEAYYTLNEDPHGNGGTCINYEDAEAKCTLIKA